MRLDKYLKVSRLIKRRPVANEACDAGRITVNGKVAKASLNVKIGDIIEIGFGDKQVKVEVLSLEETYKKEHNGELLFERREDGTPLRPKYELITSHTARRSCITNLYLQGRFTNEQIMSISGHKDEKTFKAYIVCSGIIIAERIMEINEGKSNAGLFM